MPIATEPSRKTVANIWLRADSVRRHRLAHCEGAFFDYRLFESSKPNHNLFREQGFKDVDLIRDQPSFVLPGLGAPDWSPWFQIRFRKSSIVSLNWDSPSSR